MLVLHRAAAGPVEGEERQAEQRQRRERELRGDDHDGAEAEQDADGRGLHLQVRAEVPEEVRVLGQRDGAGDEQRVDEEEDRGGRHGGGEVAGGERVPVPVEAAQRLQDEAGRRDRERVLPDVEDDAVQRLALVEVDGEDGGRDGQHGERHAGGEQQRHGEGRGRRDLALQPVVDEAHGQELARDEAGHEDPDARVVPREQAREVAEHDHRDERREAEDGDEVDVSTQGQHGGGKRGGRPRRGARRQDQ